MFDVGEGVSRLAFRPPVLLEFSLAGIFGWVLCWVGLGSCRDVAVALAGALGINCIQRYSPGLGWSS